jgi:hypothetical protein
MNQIEASLLERKYAASTGLKATFHQTENVLTVATRGPGFALDETLYLDGRTDPSNLFSRRTKPQWSPVICLERRALASMPGSRH